MDVQTGILDNYSDTRLARLEAETIARKFSTEASWLRNRIDQIIAGIENRVIERILVSRLRKAMRHSASEAAAEKLISEMRTGYETGALETMPSFFPRKYHAVPDDQHGTPANKKNWRQRLLYVPGGGFIFPPSRKQKSMLQRLSQETDSEVIVGTHRLAPEEPFPAAPNDIAQRFIALTGEDETDEPLFLGADTAGASVALGAVQLLKAKNARLPDGIILFSPWCDLSLSGWSYITRSITAQSPFRMETAAFCARMYLQRHSATDPLASPVFASLEGWPPILIHTSENDLHFDDAIQLAENGEKENCRVRLHYWDSPRHHLERLSSRDAENSFREVRQFMAENGFSQH